MRQAWGSAVWSMISTAPSAVARMVGMNGVSGFIGGILSQRAGISRETVQPEASARRSASIRAMKRWICISSIGGRPTNLHPMCQSGLPVRPSVAMT